ncbi:MAG: amidohydrolase family protein [Pseudomonadaceae bacterium]|nr:amidohydrolase family protein [Pseudomonadaceae bacterium]
MNQDIAHVSERPLLLTGLKIWDGNSYHAGDSIRIEGRRITALGAMDELSAGCDIRSLPGITAIPGLIDAHVHMELDPENRKPPAFTDPSVYPGMLTRAQAMVRAGITTARDLGGGAWLEMRLRDEIKADEALGPRLLCAGQPITIPNGHCHFWGGHAETPDEALMVLERQVAHQADLIKVMATGGQMTPGSQPKDSQYPESTLRSIVARASEHDLSVAAHCHGTDGIRNAANAGVLTIEHCSWVGPDGWGANYDPEVAATIAANQLWVSPTINRGWQRYLRAENPKPLARVRANFAAMRDAGVRFIASTDAGIPGVFHHHLPQALDVFARVTQFSAEQVLRSATSNAADALGLGAETGRLASGLSADLVLLDGDPLIDLGTLSRPVGVWARGIEIQPSVDAA